MRVINFIFEDFIELKRKIDEDSLDKEENLLVQFFDGRCDELLFDAMAKDLKQLLPKAVILGTSTAGEIHNGKMYEDEVVISFCSFKKTKLVPLYDETCGYNGAINISKQIPENSKAALFFTEGFTGYPEDFICTISKLHPNLIVGGGVAANNGKIGKTFISLGDEVYKSGVVGVTFENPDLIVFKEWKLDWNPIGKTMIVTKADGQTLYELDNTHILDVVVHYFGKESIYGTNALTATFPLILNENGVNVARASLTKKDNSLVFAGNLSVGDRVRFGVVDIYGVTSNNKCFLHKPEVLWIYSCMGRKAVLGELLESEFSSFDALSANCGFFTHGEFFTAANSAKMLNLTTTLFGLSEEEKYEKSIPKNATSIDIKSQNIASLSHLTNTVANELAHTIKELDAYKIVLDESSVVTKTDKNTVITYVNDLFLELSGYSREEVIGKTHHIIRHPDEEKSKLLKIWETAMSGKVWRGTLMTRAKNGETKYIKTTIVPIFDEDRIIIGYITASSDLTTIITQQQIIHKQTTDQLTGLPNRIKFFDDVDEIEVPLLAILNIDDFSKINRFYGFHNGNSLLIEFSELLKNLLLEYSNFSPKLYRLAADNFAILCCNEDKDMFCCNIDSIIKNLHSHHFLNEKDINIRISGGIASGKKELLSRAEQALRQAKVRNTFWLSYDESDELKEKKSFEMLHILRTAIEADMVFPLYQPIVDLKTNNTYRYEALIRLIDEQGNLHTPSSFLEIAKKSKYYQALTRIMVKKSIK